MQATQANEDPAVLALPLLNGWTVGSALERIEERNGWRRSHMPGRPNECVYRTPNGRACAAGAFIPDDAYRPDFEGAGAEAFGCGSDPRAFPSMPFPLPNDRTRSGGRSPMGRLQALHDGGAFEDVPGGGQRVIPWSRATAYAFLAEQARALQGGAA